MSHLRKDIADLDATLEGLRAISTRQTRERRAEDVRRQREGYEHVGGGVSVRGTAESKARWREAQALERGRAVGRGLASNPRWSTSEVQTLLFPRESFTVKQAWAWAKRHGYRQTSPDVTDEYVRLRQRDPGEFGEMRTIEFGRGGIKAVVGEPRARRNPVCAAPGCLREATTLTFGKRAYCADHAFPAAARRNPGVSSGFGRRLRWEPIHMACGHWEVRFMHHRGEDPPRASAPCDRCSPRYMGSQRIPQEVFADYESAAAHADGQNAQERR